MNKTDSLQLARGLIERGDSLQIKSGLLEILPKSGKKIPCEWLSDNEEGMVATLLWMTRRKGYRYIRFTRSGEGYSGGRFPGVTLHFREVESDHNAYLVFNTEVIKASGELWMASRFMDSGLLFASGRLNKPVFRSPSVSLR